MNDRKQYARNQLLTKIIKINDQYSREHGGQVVKHGVDGVDGSDGRHGDDVNFHQTGITFDTSKVSDRNSHAITYGPMLHLTVRLILNDGVDVYGVPIDIPLGTLDVGIVKECEHIAICEYNAGSTPPSTTTITIPVIVKQTGEMLLKCRQTLPAGTKISFNTKHVIA